MSDIADTPKPPYYAVIFSSQLTKETAGYAAMADRMISLAQQQSGFLGVESVRDNLGVTISYWKDVHAIKRFKANLEHQQAQKLGREKWYAAFKIRIAKVERDYSI